jgi:hypothetical protein
LFPASQEFSCRAITIQLTTLTKFLCTRCLHVAALGLGTAAASTTLICEQPGIRLKHTIHTYKKFSIQDSVFRRCLCTPALSLQAPPTSSELSGRPKLAWHKRNVEQRSKPLLFNKLTNDDATGEAIDGSKAREGSEQTRPKHDLEQA